MSNFASPSAEPDAASQGALSEGAHTSDSSLRWLTAAYLKMCDLLYTRFAWLYDPVSLAVSLGQWDAWRSAALPWVRGASVLEIGFGTGALLPRLAAQCESVFGLEPSPAMHRVAARRLRRHSARIQRVQARAQSIPFDDLCLDTVVATFPAPYLIEEETVAEIARVLRPGGAWVVAGLWVTPRRAPWRWLPLFYSPRPEALLRRLEAQAQGNGIALSAREVEVGWARVGVVIGNKKGGAQ